MEEASEPVELYRKVLAAEDDGAVTIVSIGFLENVGSLFINESFRHSVRWRSQYSTALDTCSLAQLIRISLSSALRTPQLNSR